MEAIEAESLMIPQVMVLSSLVPPLQAKLHIPNFIVDLNGNTSTGKSTALRLAASTFGNPDDTQPDTLVLPWENTKTAVEQIAGMCSGLPVFLDDAQHLPDDLKKGVIYMIASGRGKGRGAKSGGIRETPTWQTVALSTSEEPLHESSPHEGGRARILPVGGFVPPFPANSANLVQALENYVYVNHGHAGEIYVRHLNGLTAQDWDRLRQRYVAIRASMGKYTTSDIAGRVSVYIAAIQLAAEIACPLIGLPFRPETVSAWLAFHLDEQQREQNMIPRVLRMLADHFFANQILFPSQDSSIGGPQIKQDLQGTARMKEYVAFTRSALDVVFKRHRLNTTAILNKLADARVLITTEKDRHTKKVVVGGLQHRMVCIRWAALFPDEFQP